MANFETGHYFLTMLAPVRVGASAGNAAYSYRQRLLDLLASMPNSETSVLSRGMPSESPFARDGNTMTHLARFVLIDTPPYNGRDGGDTLLSKLGGGTAGDPTVAQPVDAFATPYLLFAADFDAADGSDAALRKFTDVLWSTMAKELRDIFGQCYGFEAVDSADGFFSYVKKCQVETTMPFNDYWRPADEAKLPQDLALPLGALTAVADRKGLILGALGVWAICFLLAVFLRDSPARDAAAFVARWGLLIILVVLAVVGAYVWRLYKAFLAKGSEPFPRGAQLPDVLKSIYLQQKFLDFVIANQGAAPAALHAAFGRFVADYAPAADQPTQRPGIIRQPHTDPQGASA